MSPKFLICRIFGGVRGVARSLNISASAVSQWRDRPIPLKYHGTLIAAARVAGRRLSTNDLIVGRKRCLKRNSAAK